MRLSNRKRVAWAMVAAVAALGLAWSSSSADVPAHLIAASAVGGGFGQSPQEPQQREAAPRVYMNLPVNEQVARTWGKLQEHVPMRFANETPLEDVLKSIKTALVDPEDDQPGIQFYVDPIGLAEADKTMVSPVKIDLEGVPLTTTLDLVLKQLGLGYHVQKDGIVVISNAETVENTAEPMLLILDELRALRAEVGRLRGVPMGGGMGGMSGAGGGLR